VSERGEPGSQRAETHIDDRVGRLPGQLRAVDVVEEVLTVESHEAAGADRGDGGRPRDVAEEGDFAEAVAPAERAPEVETASSTLRMTQ
jgi:hypothetical protein